MTKIAAGDVALLALRPNDLQAAKFLQALEENAAIQIDRI